MQTQTATQPLNVPQPARVLLVEDSGFFRRALESTLTRYGFLVTTATDGQEAIQALANGTFQAVVLDLFIPKINGMALVRMVKMQQRYASLPIIVLSSHEDKKDISKLHELGVKRVLSKTGQEFNVLAKDLCEYLDQDVRAIIR